MIPLLAPPSGEQTLNLEGSQARLLALSSVHLSRHAVEQDHLKKGFINTSNALETTQALGDTDPVTCSMLMPDRTIEL